MSSDCAAGQPDSRKIGSRRRLPGGEVHAGDSSPTDGEISVFGPVEGPCICQQQSIGPLPSPVRSALV